MRPCSRVGVELSWRCNWACTTCFYHFDQRLHKKIDKPWVELKEELDAAKLRNCDHAVAVGWGEPAIAPTVRQFLDYSHQIGLRTSLITNGTALLKSYQEFYSDHYLDHLHVSCHGLGSTLDKIAGVSGAFEAQSRLTQWLRDSALPWRANITLQQLNYKQLPILTKDLLDHGCRHVVFLGFLPHYAWQAPDKLQTVAVHPAALQPVLEQCIDLVLQSNRLVTLRYHPFCFIRPQYWKYITNARYVLFDPWEWDYGSHSADIERVWANSVEVGERVAVQRQPCTGCKLRMHCGGWNRFYVDGLDIKLRGLIAKDALEQDRGQLDVRGHFHDQNPANACTGSFGG